MKFPTPAIRNRQNETVGPWRALADQDKAVAQYENGVLTINLPKSEASHAKSVKIN